MCACHDQRKIAVAGPHANFWQIEQYPRERCGGKFGRKCMMDCDKWNTWRASVLVVMEGRFGLFVIMWERFSVRWIVSDERAKTTALTLMLAGQITAHDVFSCRRRDSIIKSPVWLHADNIRLRYIKCGTMNYMRHWLKPCSLILFLLTKLGVIWRMGLLLVNFDIVSFA